MHLKPNTDQEYRVLWKCTYYEFFQHSAELDDLPCSNYIHLQSFSVGKEGRREEKGGGGEGRRRKREKKEKGGGGEGEGRRRRREKKGGEEEGRRRRRRREEKGGGRRRELELVFVSDEYSVTSAVQEQG